MPFVGNLVQVITVQDELHTDGSNCPRKRKQGVAADFNCVKNNPLEWNEKDISNIKL